MSTEQLLGEPSSNGKDWIAEKTAYLIKEEGKDSKQAYAMATSMYQQMMKKKHAAGKGTMKQCEEQQAEGGDPNLSEEEIMEIVFAESSLYFDIPILKVGPTKNEDEITSEIWSDILSTYNPREVHEAPVVTVPHADEMHGYGEGEALGYAKRLYAKAVSGTKWIFATVKAASEEAGRELTRLLSGPMKFNSPELQKLCSGHVRPEIYTKSGTTGWPGDAQGHWYLRRINLLGAQPPAQFGMPQAVYSDNRGQYQIFGGQPMDKKEKEQEKKLDETKTEEKVEVKAEQKPPVQEPPAVKEQKALAHDMKACPNCGKEYADGSSFCPSDGNKLSETAKAMAEKTLADELKTRLTNVEKQLAEANKQNRMKDVQAKLEKLTTQDPVRISSAVKDGALKLAEYIDADVMIPLSEGEQFRPMDLVIHLFELLPPITTSGNVGVKKEAGPGTKTKASVASEINKFQTENKIKRYAEAVEKYVKLHPEDEKFVR